jgi:pimeloyl-ACP methyl ester carboxylesterase
MTSTNPIAMTPFTVNVPQDDLDDLQARLERTRFAQGLPDAGWSQGADEGWVRDLVAYWQDGFDWRAVEAKLNRFPQLTTEIDGQNIHFLHARSTVETATPLILVHGWPGSILEFVDVIGPLTDPEAHGGKAEDAFHVVVPSLPGFGFSGPTHERGWNSKRVAQAFATLMERIGYDRYGVQGGDWGAFVVADMARVAPDRVIGVHVNSATYGFIPWGEVDPAELETFSEVERARLARLQNYLSDGNGYFQIQATRPQTVAYGLTDSPVGQLAWIGEKFHDWSFDKDNGISRDEILAAASLYWFTETAASTARMYYESMHSTDWPVPVQVPTGVAAFAEDVAIRRYGEQGFNIVHWSDFEHGGHFAAMEAPDLFVGDLREFFGKVR